MTAQVTRYLQNVFSKGEAVLRVRMVDFKVMVTLIVKISSLITDFMLCLMVHKMLS